MRVFFLVLLFTPFVGCNSLHLREQNEPEICVYVAPFQSDFGTLLIASENALLNKQLAAAKLRPSILGIVLINCGRREICLPSFNADTFGGTCLQLELRKDGKTFFIRRNIADRDQLLTSYLNGLPLTSKYEINIMPGEAIVIPLDFTTDAWENIDLIIASKEEKTAQIRAVYEIYQEDNGQRSSMKFYSGWVNLGRIIPFPISREKAKGKLVF